jgi:hypothetical protein
VKNLTLITQDVEKITAKTRTEEGKKTLELLHDLVWRLEPLKEPSIRQFLQKEGVRVRMF